MLDLAFRPDRGRREPLYRQLELYLRGLIEARRIVSGERLPASRELAATLGLSRNTVNQAYQALVEDGLLRSHVGQGTFVAGRPGGASAPPPVARAFAWEGLAARRVQALAVPRVLESPCADPPRFDFRPGRVDTGSLPTTELKRAYTRALDRADELADEVDPRGYGPLREALARALVARGVQCAAHEVAIVNGAQQALDLVSRVLIDPGDGVVVEQPGYFGAGLAFSACQAHLIGVGVDREGLRTDELARILRARRVKLLYTTPAVQSPTGVAMSDARRRALLALADEYQLPIIEDDYDGELRHGAPPVPALKALDRAGQVIYVGTFSKALFAGLRVGYVVAPPPLLQRIALTRWAADFNTDVVTQAALAELLASGGLERHVRRVRRIYAERRAALLAALERHLQDGAHWTRPAGGNAVWLRLPPDAEPAAVAAGARAEGIACGPGAAFALPGVTVAADADRHLLLSFARLSPLSIEEGIARLGRVVRAARCAGSAVANGRTS